MKKHSGQSYQVKFARANGLATTFRFEAPFLDGWFPGLTLSYGDMELEVNEADRMEPVAAAAAAVADEPAPAKRRYKKRRKAKAVR